MAERDAAADKLFEALETSSGNGVVTGLSRGLLAHARRDYSNAAVALGAVRPYLEQVGGSNIQRDLFERIFADSVRRMRMDRPLLRQAA